MLIRLYFQKCLNENVECESVGNSVYDNKLKIHISITTPSVINKMFDDEQELSIWLVGYSKNEQKNLANIYFQSTSYMCHIVYDYVMTE